MSAGGALLTLTYYGAEKVMPHYNVMGVAKAALEASVRYLAADLGKSAIRVNAISAGPIKTLAASGIADFRYILKWNEYNSALRRTVTIEDVGNTAAFLCSDDARFITGETVKVDGGLLAQGIALWGTGKDNTFMKSAGVNRGTTGEAMVVRNLQSGDHRK